MSPIAALLSQFADFTRSSLVDPPPLRIGQYSLTKWKPGERVIIEPPSPGAVPIAVVWKEP